MHPTKLIRSAAANGLSLTAKSLSLAAKTAGAIARFASVDDDTAADRTKDRADDRADGAVVITDAGPAQEATTAVSDTPVEQVDPGSDEVDRRGRVVAPATETVPDVALHVRTHDTHAAELAARPAAEVVDAITDLSTDELSQLLEEEQRGKKRTTVLTAIERALLPPVSSEELERQSAAASRAGGVPTAGSAGGPAQRARV